MPKQTARNQTNQEGDKNQTNPKHCNLKTQCHQETKICHHCVWNSNWIKELIGETT